MFDEDLAVQMIDFMLQTDGKQPLGFDQAHLSIQVEVTDRNTFRTLDLVVDAWHREAAFLSDLSVGAAFQNFGVDQRQQLVASLRNVDHDQPFMYINLSRCEPDAWRLVHRFRHVARQTA